MALDEPREEEQTIPADGLEILVSDKVKPYASGNTLDWVQAFGGEGFVLVPEFDTGCS